MVQSDNATEPYRAVQRRQRVEAALRLEHPAAAVRERAAVVVDDLRANHLDLVAGARAVRLPNQPNASANHPALDIIVMDVPGAPIQKRQRGWICCGEREGHVTAAGGPGPSAAAASC